MALHCWLRLRCKGQEAFNKQEVMATMLLFAFSCLLVPYQLAGKCLAVLLKVMWALAI